MLEVEIGQCLITVLLHERGMSLGQLSQRTGISTQRLSDYANGVRPSMTIKTAKIIAIALNCSIDDLYEWRIKH
ncbi:helix-turn-helix domain-containing protein [Bacillus nakamurai]|uniref:helix-turn-helix domain-containing protein n=1 Tax=Bacillus nakamurai TaxID=1793963 RepID=UPI001E44051D|nr:helix-turn-helix transcriptional regulator [Bacillus nakamurai]MCC9021763.1 helix-turn-helix transcriptional regulator [Bacillus nakamurai]